MTEADLITTGFMGIQTRMLLWGTEFTLIFGYLAALYFFLRQTSAAFRAFTFVIFAVTIAFMWIGFAGTDIGSERYLDARANSIELGLLPPYWEIATTGRIDRMLSAASWLGHAMHALAVVGCFYVTFFYRWRRVPDARAPERD